MLPQITRRFSVSLQLATLAGFYVVFAAFVLLMVLQPGNQAEGRQLLQTLERPEVSLDRNFTPRSVDEGEMVSVKVKLDRALVKKEDGSSPPPHDEADITMPTTYPQGKPICHHGTGTDDDEVLCIEGGIFVWDSYNDSAKGDSADRLVAFGFRKPFEDDDADTSGNQRLERILSYPVCDDGRAGDDRAIRIEINLAFEDASHPQRPPPETYGYDIEHYTINVSVKDSGSLVPTCADVRGVIVEPTELEVQEGNTETYTVELTHPPTHEMTITATADGDVEVSDDGNSFGETITLTFTAGESGNWRTAQTVTVRGKTDQDAQDGRGTITHMLTTADTDYSDVNVTVVDTDTPPGPDLFTLVAEGQ